MITIHADRPAEMISVSSFGNTQFWALLQKMVSRIKMYTGRYCTANRMLCVESYTFSNDIMGTIICKFAFFVEE